MKRILTPLERIAIVPLVVIGVPPLLALMFLMCVPVMIIGAFYIAAVGEIDRTPKE